MKDWEARLPALCQGVRQAHLLGADPGALAVLAEIEPRLRERVRQGAFFVEGWALERGPTGAQAFDLERLAGSRPGTVLWIGARMDFRRTREIFRHCRENAVRAVFVFDHWKNYTRHFWDEAAGELELPDDILVPDALARTDLLAAWSAIPALAAARSRVRLSVFGQPAIEAAAQRIAGLQQHLDKTTPPMAALFLDPYPPGGDFGYDVFSVIAFLSSWLPRHRPGVRLVVKGHPRQSPPLTRAAFSAWEARSIAFELASEPMETLVARADEVYGMTSVALLIALAAGKPITSFQPGRNLAGMRESNSHLERYVIS